MSRHFTESVVEEAALGWLEEFNYTAQHGPDMVRGAYSEPVLPERLRVALRKLNPKIPAAALEEAFRKVTTPQHPSLIANNRAFHKMLVDGVPVEYRDGDRNKTDLGTPIGLSLDHGELAHHQPVVRINELQTYKHEIPSLLVYNALLAG